MLSPRLYFTFLILAASLFLHGRQPVQGKAVCCVSSYKAPVHEAQVAGSFCGEGLKAMDADLDEEDQDTKSSFHPLVVIPAGGLHSLSPRRHEALHFCKNRAAFTGPALISVSILYSVWRL